MVRRKIGRGPFGKAVACAFALAIVWGASQGAFAEGMPAQPNGEMPKMRAITNEQRFEAAARAAAQRAAEAAQNPLAGDTGAPLAGDITTPIDYFGTIPNYHFSPILPKFVDSLPGVGAANANNLGNYIPIATKDTTTYPGSDYYQLSLENYTWQFHQSMLPSHVRGYRDQQATGTDALNHYLGPLIIATKDRPVRVKFTNNLPVGHAGDLPIPTDTSIMGAGLGPDGVNSYTQNRATLHLHGGNSPWISDGTPHQWTAPVGENTTIYLKGDAARDVPDMPPTGPGELTFYWTNQQSGRLMFYHDHAFGITRLNVYCGEAAGYLITDPAEEGLINTGKIPGAAMPPEYRYGIPLVLQDRTFIDPTTLAATDPTWATTWGGPNDLWYPHVYMPSQNPGDPSGVNAMGRWDYGPWLWPPLTVSHPPILVSTGHYIPGTPNPSHVAEAYVDTPVVNGQAYPYLTVGRKAYRFRILNAANERMWNLQLYKADPTITTGPGVGTEVKMVPAVPTAGFPPKWPTDGRDGGVPDPALQGPPLIQIGNEGGLLPQPVVINCQPQNHDNDYRSPTFGNLRDKALLMAAAERADVIIDFSQVPDGTNLILYSDCGAPIPGGDSRYDFYTNNPDLRAIGGTAPTTAGYGPNTRTIMQFRVSGAVADPPFDLAGLMAVWPTYYRQAQDLPNVPESAYNWATGKSYTDNYLQLEQNSISLVPAGKCLPTTYTIQAKAIVEGFDVWGRINALLGIEVPFTGINNPTVLGFADTDPPNDKVKAGEMQLWRITHGGTDNHGVHVHLFDAQVINRVKWDGTVMPPDPNELGWKDTIRMQTHEDTIIAVRPKSRSVPFGLSDSIRTLNPCLPLHSTMGFSGYDDKGNPAVVTNEYTNFGQEYAWHCHLLTHEENDMMHPLCLDPVNVGGRDLLLNGGFESGSLAPWTVVPAGSFPTLGTTVVADGVYSCQMGDGGPGLGAGNTAEISQAVKIGLSTQVPPALSFEYKIVGTPNDETHDWMRVYVNGNQVGSLFEDTHGLWSTFYYDLSAYRGKTVTIAIKCWTATAVGSVNYYLDSVQVRGCADLGYANFDRDGCSDVLLRNPVTGETRMLYGSPDGGWDTSRTTSCGNLNGWAISLGDFDGDGVTDLLLVNLTSGDAYLEFCDTVHGGIDWTKQKFVANLSAWIVQLADFDGDGRSDLLLKHKTTGDSYFEYMNSAGNAIDWTRQAYGANLTGFNTDSEDFTGGLEDEHLLTNAATGASYLEFITPTGFDWSRQAYLANLAAWNVYPGDYDFDGVADLLLVNKTTGDAYIEELLPGGAGIDWTKQAYLGCFAGFEPFFADVNGDGALEILLRSLSTGQSYLEYLNPATGAIDWTKQASLGDLEGEEIVFGDYDAYGTAETLHRDAGTGTAWMEYLSPTGGWCPAQRKSAGWGTAFSEFWTK